MCCKDALLYLSRPKINCFKPFTTPKLGFEVWNNLGELLSVSKFKNMHVLSICLIFRKQGFWDGLKLLRNQIYARSCQLISCDATSEESTSFKILFPQGQSKALNSREWMFLKEISKEKAGIWEKHWQDKMGNTGSTCWRS